jgi:hypothetical protein
MSGQSAGISRIRPHNGAGLECPPAVRGSVAEWLCRGLQIPVRRFNSGPSLHFKLPLKNFALHAARIFCAPLAEPTAADSRDEIIAHVRAV